MKGMAIKMRTIIGVAGFLLAMSVGKGVVLTNYSDVCGHVKYQSLTYTSSQSVFENYYDSFLGGQIWRGVVEFGIAAFPTNPQSPILLIMKVTASASGNTNYAFNLVSYTNANGVVNTNDYGCAATAVGTLCSNFLPVVGQVFTSDVTAVVQAARTNGLTNIGFRVQTNPDSSSALDLQFNDAQNGEGIRLAWSPTLPMINNDGGASGVTTSAATLNGGLTATGAAPAYVNVYWGTNDGGTNISSWTNAIPLGPRGEGSFSTNISGLTTNRLYYYRCFASNSFGFAWADASTNFITPAGPNPGSLRFNASTSAVNENAGTVAISVIRTGGSNGIASVNYVTSNGTALAGTEYTATNGALSWADNDASSKTVTVAIVDNSEYGTNKTFLVILTNAVSAALGAPATNTVTIVENDPAPVPGTLKFSAATTSVNENGGSVRFTVTRTSGSNGLVSVDYTTSNGTALAGTEYTATNGTLSWADNDASSKTVTVAVVDNSEYGTNKTFLVILTNAVSAALGAPATNTVTILENDPAPVPGTLAFNAAAASVAENAGSVTLAVTRTGGGDGTATVHYATADGTAMAGSNYLAGAGTLAWLNGDTADKTLTVTILDNGVYQGDKSFSVNLSNPGGASLGSPDAITVTIVENDPPPAPPTVVTASDGTYGDKIRVTWSSVADALYYEIWRGTNLDQLTMIQRRFVLAGPAYNDTNVEAFVTYYYRVKSSNTVGASDFSAFDTGWQRMVAMRVAADFDGDSKADPAAFDNGLWYVWLSSAGYMRMGPYAFGAAGNMPVAADFDGDGKSDPAVYDGANWTEWLSGSGYAAAGPYPYSVADMTPVAADFDGDRKADPSGYVFGSWYVWLSSAGYLQLGPFPFGAVMAAPVAADFDGDGLGDPGAYFPITWTEWRSGSGYADFGPYPFGVEGGIPVAADFDGDAKADPAAVASDEWTVWFSSAGYTPFGPYPLPVSP